MTKYSEYILHVFATVSENMKLLAFSDRLRTFFSCELVLGTLCKTNMDSKDPENTEEENL